MTRNLDFYTRLLAIGCLCASAASAQLSLDNAKQAYEGKGIITERGSGNSGGGTSNRGRSVVKFDVLLARGGEELPVSTQFRFVTGDKFKLRVTPNSSGYLYVLNRTMNGDAESLANKGIERVVEEDRQNPAGASYRLLYPLRKDDNQVKGKRAVTVPGDGSFVMDTKPGVEKIHVIVSAQPLDIAKMFNLEDGEMQRSNQNDTAGDVLNQLNTKLASYAQNAELALAESNAKGVRRESYGVVRDTGKPALVEISLKHLSQ